MSASLSRLEFEWRNVAQLPREIDGRWVDMPALAAALLELKARKTYTEVWRDLALGVHARHAHNEDFVLHLLYLVDERPVPVSVLQRSIGMQLGHLFRTLERAGVEFRAHTTSFSSRLREGYWPWGNEIFLDPLRGTYLRGGEEFPIPEGLEVYLRDGEREDWDGEDDEERGEDQGVRDRSIGLIDPGDLAVPLPIVPIFRRHTPPPRPPRRA